ncbi:MAG TPA: F0F1 ATP synthase subunit A [Chloroflexota bacterium]|nr:F0F1 ATP synthase subunit A [Chloroflexota bacterium]
MTDTVPVQEQAKSSRRGLLVGLAIIGLVLVLVGILFPVALAPVEISSSIVTTVFGFPIANTLITGWISIILLAVLFGLATRSMKLVPTGLQNLAEWIVDALVGMAENVAGRERGREFFALFATIFLYVLVNNWLELLPGVTNATIFIQKGTEKIPLFRSPSADLDFTLMLALSAVFMVQFWSIKHTGWGGWAGKFINLKGGPIGVFVGFLETISEVAKIISFSFRLFGNLFAGDILLSVVPFLVPWVVVLPFMGLELFVGAVQALVFALLTLAFVTMATIAHGHGGAKKA